MAERRTLPTERHYDPIEGAARCALEANARLWRLASLLIANGTLTAEQWAWVWNPAEADAEPRTHRSQATGDDLSPSQRVYRPECRKDAEARRAARSGPATPHPPQGQRAHGAACPEICAHRIESSGSEVSRG